MPMFRKKPVVIEAVQWTGENKSAIDAFVLGLAEEAEKQQQLSMTPDLEIVIHTLEGDHRASVGDWIIRGVKGEFYPCKPDIFKSTYEEVTKPAVAPPVFEDGGRQLRESEQARRKA